MLSALESCPNRCMPPEKCWRRSGYRLARRPHSCIEHSLELGTIWNHLDMLKYCGISWCAADFLWALKCAKTKRTHTQIYTNLAVAFAPRDTPGKSLYKPNPGREWKMSQGAAFRCACQGRASPALFGCLIFKFVASNRSGQTEEWAQVSSRWSCTNMSQPYNDFPSCGSNVRKEFKETWQHSSNLAFSVTVQLTK